MATSTSERALPHSLDAERAVLGAVLVNPELWPIAASMLGRADFYRDAHARIFDAMTSLATRSVPADITLLKEELMTAGVLDTIGGMLYLSSLVDGVPRSTNVEHYAAVVRDKARLRRVVQCGSDISASAFDGADAATVVDAALRRLFDVVEEPTGGLRPAHQVVTEYASALASGTLGDRAATGFHDLDPLLGGGFRPGDLVIVAARPSVGKTALALNVGDQMSMAGLRTTMFSLEMSEQSLAGRLVASRSRVSSIKLERGEATADEYARAGQAVAEIQQAALPLVFETSSRTVAQIDAWCRRAKHEFGTMHVAIVDYLQLLKSEGRHHSDEAEVAAISHGLKRIAKDQNIIVVALSQLSRAPEARRDKRPTLADLRGSGAIEQDCDVALLLYRPEMHTNNADEEGIAEVIVAKQRNGPTGVVRLAYIKDYTKFESLAHHGVP